MYSSHAILQQILLRIWCHCCWERKNLTLPSDDFWQDWIIRSLTVNWNHKWVIGYLEMKGRIVHHLVFLLSRRWQQLCKGKAIIFKYEMLWAFPVQFLWQNLYINKLIILPHTFAFVPLAAIHHQVASSHLSFQREGNSRSGGGARQEIFPMEGYFIL